MDEADYSGEKSQTLLDAGILAIRRNAETMDAGTPGECLECGEKSKRLVGGICAPCRDLLQKYGKQGRAQTPVAVLR